MSNVQSKKSKNSKPAKEVSVLYQNLGGKIYAFTEINGQVIFGKVAIQQSTKDIKNTVSKGRGNKTKSP